MSYNKSKVTELVLELNSLLLQTSRIHLQYLPQVVDKLYSEIHEPISENNEIDIKEISKILQRMLENNEIRIKEMNSTSYASGEGIVTIYYNFNPKS